MKHQPSPEDHASILMAFLRLWARRIAQSLIEVPLKNHSVTILELDTPATMSVTIAIRRLNVVLLLAALSLSLCACTTPRPLHGGQALTTGPVHQTLTQGENPSAPSRQDQETIRTRTYTLPPGSRISRTTTERESSRLAAAPTETVVLGGPTPVAEREETRATTELGPAQKDTARELAAKLSSLKGIVWVGLALFIFGIASMFWPPLKVIIGSVTTSGAIILGGLALMVLPTLIVGNELLILGGVSLVVAAWFLAHRHGQLRGLVSVAESAKSVAKKSSPRP